MNKYIVLYHATQNAMQQSESTTPEERAKSMEQWMIWAKKCGDQLIDMGAPLMNGIAVAPGLTSTASDKGVVGYSILAANSIDEAKSLLEGHPHLGWDAECRIELHEVMPLPGM